MESVMTAAAIIMWLLVIACITLLALSAFGSAIRIRALIATNAEIEQARDEWEKLATQRISIAHQYAHAPKIIAIHRNDRVVHITVARLDGIFTIETMGLMSDNLPEWRAKCGFPDAS